MRPFLLLLSLATSKIPAEVRAFSPHPYFGTNIASLNHNARNNAFFSQACGTSSSNNATLFFGADDTFSSLSSTGAIDPQEENHFTNLANDEENNNDHHVGEERPRLGKAETGDSCTAISMTVDELSNFIGGRGRAKLVWDCYSLGVEPATIFGSNDGVFVDGDNSNISIDSQPFDYSSNDELEAVYQLLPPRRRGQSLGKKALAKLATLFPKGKGIEGGIATLSHISKSTNDDTTKLLLRLVADGLEVETVIIPAREGSNRKSSSTLCISSQVGCRQGCTFCATGRMGKLRSLSCDEILAQMYFARKICRLENLPEISNVVFMGMGEPADNFEAVVRATQILTSDELFKLSASKVCVSTVAPNPNSFRNFAKAPCVLAWSVHAVNDELRRKLVPTTKYTMAELRNGLIETLLSRPGSNNGFNKMRTIMLEVVLIDGVNDSLQEAEELSEFSKVIIDNVPGCKLVVNLIPFNEIGNSSYRKPNHDSVFAFQKELWNHGINAYIRQTRGDDETAACGQLATSKKKKGV